MKNVIIVTGNKYDYTDGVKKEHITKKQAEEIFRQWKETGLQINRKTGMGGKVTWVWIERNEA